MASFTTNEGQHTVDDGTKLYTKTWKPSGTVQAYVGRYSTKVMEHHDLAKHRSTVFVHGFSDHCHNYPELFEQLASKGIEVHAFDQRSPHLSAILTIDY